MLNNNPDGAHPQAQAVLAAIRFYFGEGIESSWNSNDARYQSDVEVHRWLNGREQGYLLTMAPIRCGASQPLCIAFAEHRSSDSIIVYWWNATTYPNPPVVASMVPEHVWSDSSRGFAAAAYDEAASFIFEKLTAYSISSK